MIETSVRSIVLLFQDGASALILASQNGHSEIVKYLIEAKASLDLQRQVCCPTKHASTELINKVSVLIDTYPTVTK